MDKVELSVRVELMQFAVSGKRIRPIAASLDHSSIVYHTKLRWQTVCGNRLDHQPLIGV